ncbi:MAG: NUDIX hydrolase [Candidatus Kapaibacterium sp.]|nr:NUDIX hydrolase [Bacteroidota bacterium]
MLTTLDTISSELILENPYWQYKHDRYVMPNGKEGSYFYVNTHGSVFIIPVTDDGTFVLTKQYRYLNQRVSIEFPGGGIKDGITPEEQARLELQEETGYTCSSLRHIGVMNPMNGVTNELCYVYIATGLTYVGAKPEESEEFLQVEYSRKEITSAIQSNEIWDGMTLAAWAMALHHLEK